MNKEKVFIEGHVVGLFADTLGTKGKQIQIASGNIVDIDDKFIYKSIEPEKVKVPEFIEDWIFKCQLLKDFSLRDALDSNTIHLYAKNSEFVKKWLKVKKNQEIFARAWLFDYEAEKEPKYRVKLKNTDDYLNETETGFHFYNNYKNNKIFTRKELEYSDFGWVFDCPGIEVTEVE